MANILTLTPNALLNFIHRGRFQSGESTRSKGFEDSIEGKGINVAKVLVAHGHQVTASGFAGGPSGDWFRAGLHDLGIIDAMVPTKARLRCGFLAAANDGPPTLLLEDGFTVTADEYCLFVETITSLIPRQDLVTIGGSMPHPTCLDLVCDCVRLCTQARVPCWVDAYGPAMTKALSDVPMDLAKPNAEEYAAMGPWNRVGEIHRSKGAGHLTIFLGDDRFEVWPPQVSSVNPVGCGDCYLAGLAHARLSGWSPEAQWRYACGCGAANAERAGVADFDPARAQELAQQVHIGRESHA